MGAGVGAGVGSGEGARGSGCLVSFLALPWRGGVS